MDIWALIGAFVVGMGTGWALKVVIYNRTNKNTRVTSVSQKGNIAGGNIVGGDVSKKE